MAFKVKKKLSVIKWPVTVHEPVDGGKTETHEFVGHFDLKTQNEYDELVKRNLSDADFITELLKGWEGLIDDDTDKEIVFSAANLREVVKYPYVRTAITRAYQQAINGAAVKN